MNFVQPIGLPTEADLVASAEAMIPALRERAAQGDRDCRLPVETIQDFQDAGFFKILQPRRYGGYEMDPQTFYAVQMKVAEGCMSSAWVLGVVAVHNWQLALFDAQAQEDVWGDDPTTLIASSYMPKGQATPSEGGYRVSGRWGFSSGVDHCEWAFLGGQLIDPETGKPDFVTFLIPRKDFKVIPVWNTIGLGATGSHDVTVEDAYVPAYRVHRSKDGFAVTSPGLKVNDAPLFKLPFGQVFVRAVSSSSIGALQGALDLFREAGARRVSHNDASSAAQDPSTLELIAETTAAIDEMKAVLSRNFDDLMRLACAEQNADVPTRLTYRYQSAQVSGRCADLISRIFHCSGAEGIFRDRPISRIFCDINAGRTHVANNPVKVGRNFGNVMLGAPNADSFI
ncbi:MAG: flavin-dependent monooxygenase [Sphingomonadales bacterium]|nr:flavin-dependent monooxygenase [Sphingomonadales bacterium]